MQCPACHYDRSDGRTSCEACGLIFAKYDPGLPAAVKARRDQRAQETPENGWATHHIGKFEWREGPMTSTSRDGVKVTPAGSGSGLLMLFIFLYAFLGAFPIIFSGGKLVPYYLEGLGLLVGAYLFFVSFDKLKQKRLMQDTPLSTVRAMAPGQVELAGTTVGPPALTAPFTGDPCVYFEALIEERTESGKNETWTTLEKRDTRDKPFFLNDGTGQVAIHPPGAETKFASPYFVEVHRRADAPAPILAYLSAQSLEGRLAARPLRFTERRLEAEKPVFVMGVCQKTVDPSGQEEVFIGRGDPRDVFLFSDIPREKLERGFGIQAALALFFGIALIGVSVYGLVKGWG